MNAPAGITPPQAESGQAARSPGAAAAALAGHLAGITRTARALAAATVLLLAGPAAAVEPPAFDSPLHRDHLLAGEIRAIADGAAVTPARLAA